jgi:regulator of replication initiation timing
MRSPFRSTKENELDELMDEMRESWAYAFKELEALRAHVDEQVAVMQKSAPSTEVERLRKQLGHALGADFS